MVIDIEKPLSHGRLKKIGRFALKSFRRLNASVIQAQKIIFKYLKSDKKLVYKLSFLLTMSLMPLISQAATDAQVREEIKTFSQPIDPINAGDFAQDASKYIPGINFKPEDVTLAMMVEDDSYTLTQQLSVNSNRQIDEPERQQATYTIQKGETVTQIALRFNLHVASILDANGIKPEDLKKVQPGTVLNIPSSDTSTSDDWLVAINKAEEQARQQQLQAQQAAAAKKKKIASATGSTSRTYSGGGSVNGVRYVRAANANEMQCYGYVVSQGYTVSGHVLARWIPTNSSTPRAGGLVVTSESWAGHVAIVTSVNGDGTFNIRESNYVHGLITERTLSVNSGKIIGFVN